MAVEAGLSVYVVGGQGVRLFVVVDQIGAGLYAVGRPVQKRNDEDGQIGTIQSLPLERGALFITYTSTSLLAANYR